MFLVIRAILANTVGYVYQGIQSDYIDGTERCGLRTTDDWAGQFIDFLYRHTQVFHGMEKALNTKDSNTISNKSRSIFGHYRSFTQILFSINVQKIKNLLGCFRPRNDLKKFKIPRWVKEVCSAEMLLKIFATPFAHKLDRNTRRIRSN